MSSNTKLENTDSQEVDLTQNSKPRTINKYQPLKIRKEHKKSSLFAKIKIFFELSFLILTFLLSLRKAIYVVMARKETVISKSQKQLSQYKNDGTTQSQKKEMKVGICTFGKNDNKYIREFVQYYEKCGVDKIFLYDNNDSKGEKFDDVISDYISSGLVQISDWRGKTKKQLKMMNDCYKKNNDKYDWLIFYELDEYIHLKDFTSIKQFLGQEKFNTCKKIYLNWVHHTDNNLMHYENRTLKDRFPEKESIPSDKKITQHVLVKSIIRGNISNVEFDCEHKLSNEFKGCNAEGIETSLEGCSMLKPDYENNYIDHYHYKSVDEFIEKLNLGDVNKTEELNNYFEYNKINSEKFDYIQKKTGLDLSSYKKALKKSK
jgi:hypothetical protein